MSDGKYNNEGNIKKNDNFEYAVSDYKSINNNDNISYIVSMILVGIVILGSCFYVIYQKLVFNDTKSYELDIKDIISSGVDKLVLNKLYINEKRFSIIINKDYDKYKININNNEVINDKMSNGSIKRMFILDDMIVILWMNDNEYYLSIYDIFGKLKKEYNNLNDDIKINIDSADDFRIDGDRIIVRGERDIIHDGNYIYLYDNIKNEYINICNTNITNNITSGTYEIKYLGEGNFSIPSNVKVINTVGDFKDQCIISDEEILDIKNFKDKLNNDVNYSIKLLNNNVNLRLRRNSNRVIVSINNLDIVNDYEINYYIDDIYIMRDIILIINKKTGDFNNYFIDIYDYMGNMIHRVKDINGYKLDINDSFRITEDSLIVTYTKLINNNIYFKDGYKNICEINGSDYNLNNDTIIKAEYKIKYLGKYIFDEMELNEVTMTFGQLLDLCKDET